MSREQWGHGYWKGVADAKRGVVSTNAKDEVMFWIANMCVSNQHKAYDASLYPVKEWLFMCRFCGVSERYAKKVYDYILDHNFYEFEPGKISWCYITGQDSGPWTKDYFCIPVSAYTESKWLSIKDNLFRKIKENRNEN